MEHEREKYEKIQYRYAKYWLPFQWALALCQEARQKQTIASDWLLEKVSEVRRKFLLLFSWIIITKKKQLCAALMMMIQRTVLRRMR